jgi:hypothetical protein
MIDSQPKARKGKKYLQRYSGNGYLAESVVIDGKPCYAVVKDNKITIEDHTDEYYPPISDLSRPYTFVSDKHVSPERRKMKVAG